MLLETKDDVAFSGRAYDAGSLNFGYNLHYTAAPDGENATCSFQERTAALFASAFNSSDTIDAAGSLIAEFLSDPRWESLEFPTSLTADQRKRVKKLAERNAELVCESYGFGQDRQLHIFKRSRLHSSHEICSLEKGVQSFKLSKPLPPRTDLPEPLFVEGNIKAELPLEVEGLSLAYNSCSRTKSLVGASNASLCCWDDASDFGGLSIPGANPIYQFTSTMLSSNDLNDGHSVCEAHVDFKNIRAARCIMRSAL